MFIVNKINVQKPIQKSNFPSNYNKESNILPTLSSSPIKYIEKQAFPMNIFSTITNNSDTEKNMIKPKEKIFLCKKIKFHVDYICYENNVKNNINEANLYRKKKIKFKIYPSIKRKAGVNEGRWKLDEHMRFIEGLKNLGNQWRKIKKYVGTRSTNQVRSHAQKYFLKLKTFKDINLGIDFTVDTIKNFTNIINKIKEYEKKNNCDNILVIINQKLLERNIKNKNIMIGQINNAEELKKNDIDIVKKRVDLIEAINYIDEKNIFDNNNKDINEINNDNNLKIKKIISPQKIENSKKTIFEPKMENNINVEKNEKDKNYFNWKNNFDFINDEINFMSDYDNSNEFECETNDNFLFPFSEYIKETNILSIINKDYFS